MRRFLTVMTVVLAGGLLTACGDDTPTAPVDVVLESADAKLTLDIPAGALPRGVAAADITISDVSDDPESFVQSDGDPALAVVLLEPLGLEFSQPVTLTVRDLDVEPIEPPPEADPPIEVLSPISVLHIFGDDAEVITDVETEVDPATNKLTASIPLTRFSWVVVTRITDLVKAGNIVPEADVVFGDFSVTHTATRIVAPGTVVFAATFTDPEGEKDHYSRTMSEGPWTISFGSSIGSGVLEGQTLNFFTLSESVTGPTFTDTRVSFTCTSEGDGAAGYEVSATFTLNVVFNGLDLDPRQQSDSDKNSEAVVCVMPKIVALAAPPNTTYTLSTIPGGATSFVWSGDNCGFTEGSDKSTMVWHHGGEDCAHVGVGHPDATISLLVTGMFVSRESYKLECKYPGPSGPPPKDGSALTGEGASCTLIE